ncbi:MAG: aldehyde dehydrogenase family protein [Pseudomonadota bacterium]|nr:aldehyde dehydrogenase family protein [Pseudomonadota bacterium]
MINGELVAGARALDVINPAMGKPFAVASRADEAQLNSAVAAAKRAFPTWSALPVDQRRTKLLAWAEAIEARIPELAALLVAEQGKPMPEAMFETGLVPAALRIVSASELAPRVLQENATTRVIRHNTPLGVVAAIAPWNFPVMLMMLKVIPALITGNTVVAKPAPTTPLTMLLLGQIAANVLPPGVLNVIVDDNDLGSLLTGHPDVAKIAFTGSTTTGRKVMQSAVSTLKRLTLELGGNDAAIVLDDVDVKAVAQKVYMAAMMNAGQICVAAKRVYVPSRLYDGFCEELATLARFTVVGDGAREGTQMGPIQNRRQFDRLGEYLADAHEHGKIIAGGAPLPGDGYFIPPTIVRDIPDDTRLVREEQFGPVLPVLRYDDIDDAIRRANDNEYGLAGTIWTADPQRAVGIAMKIDTGTVWINKHLDLHFDVAMGGAKYSGLGEAMGQEGLEAYTQRKVIDVALQG